MNRSPTRALIAALSCVALSSALTGPASAQNPAASDAAPKKSAAPKTMTDEQKTLYALGALLSRNLGAFSLTDAEFATVRQGFSDGFHKLPDTKEAEASIPSIQAMQKDRAQKISDAYLAKAEKAPGAKKTASGLVYVSVKEGSGASPKPTDTVKVTYEGRLTDGSVFDSSKNAPGGTASFRLNGVIACWTEAVQLMKVGGKSRIVCPAAIAYGARQVSPKIPPNSTLEFDIELLDIEAPPPPAPAASSSSGATPPAGH